MPTNTPNGSTRRTDPVTSEPTCVGKASNRRAVRQPGRSAGVVVHSGPLWGGKRGKAGQGQDSGSVPGEPGEGCRQGNAG